VTRFRPWTFFGGEDSRNSAAAPRFPTHNVSCGEIWSLRILKTLLQVRQLNLVPAQGSLSLLIHKMLLLDYQNVLIQSILTERFAPGASPVSIDQIVSDFDGVTFHISTPTTKTQILISLSVKCYRDLLQYGAESVLQREYGNYITSPEAGYDFSILIDLEQLPESAEEREELVRRISLLKRNAMAAPFEKAFDEFSSLAEEASGYTSESAPQGVQEGGEVMAIHYREEEAIYIKASHDRVTVIFSTIFRDETDRIFGKVFLQEFVDARRRAIQNAPQVLFRSDPPLELQGMKGVGKTGEKGEIGFITFGSC
jgi:actin related protein 2/3 complex, subunit 2